MKRITVPLIGAAAILLAAVSGGQAQQGEVTTKFYLVEKLVAEEQTEISHHEIYLFLTNDGARERIPKVQKNVYWGKSIPIWFKAAEDVYGDNYYVMEMADDDPELKVWNICAQGAVRHALIVEVWEKDMNYKKSDGYGGLASDDDMIGTVPLTVQLFQPGRYTYDLTGDGGLYRLTVSLFDSPDKIPSCRPDSRRDPEYDEELRLIRENHGSGGPSKECQEKCDDATGNAVGSCSIQANEQCSQVATVLLSCIATCEALR